MDSSFRTLLNDFDFDVETFEKYKIHSLSKLMDNCINEVKKQRVLKLLSISKLEFDCLHDVYKEQIETQTKETIKPQNIFESNIKYWLLTKPAQSGKTMEMIRDMIINIEQNKRAINILFCDNSLIQTRQSVVRINKITMQGIVACEISSNKDSTFKRENQFAKEHAYYNAVVMCSKRLENIELLLSHLKDRDIYLYLDEADKIVKDKSKVELIKTIETYNNVKKITFTTATPYIDCKTSLATLYGNLNLFPINQNLPEFNEKYNSLKKMNVTFYKSHGDSNVMYAEEYLKNNLINPGEIWLIPSEYKKFTHNQMKQMLFENDYADVVCIINSDTKCFYYKEGNTQQLGEFATSLSEMKDIMENYIKETKKSNRIVITGNNCINRGASFQSDSFKFTGTIYGNSTTNPDGNAYQIICRMASYVTTDKAQKLIIDEHTFNLILPYEELAINILNDSVDSYNNKVVSTINHADMKKVIRKQYNSEYIFCGSRIQINGDIIDSEDFDSIIPFTTKEEAIIEIRKYYPGYNPYTQEINENGFYITANDCLHGRPRRVVSWNDMKRSNNIKYGTGENTRIRLRPCYIDVKDKSTLRWSVVIRNMGDL